MGTKRGQAMVELGAGLFALALVVSALCGFTFYIAKSLKAQNALRNDGGGTSVKSDRVDVGEFAAEYIFGTKTLKIKERVVMPQRTIPR